PPRQHVKDADRDDDEEQHTEYRASPYQYKSTEGECGNREHGQNHPSLPIPQLLLLTPSGPSWSFVRAARALARQEEHEAQQTDVAEDSQSPECPGQPRKTRRYPPPPSEVVDRPYGCQH